MFAKLMDSLAEELEMTGKGFKLDAEFIIAVLLWVDDVVSCVDGIENQEKMLENIHEFALKHKLCWGQEKCKVMRVGRHTGETKQWMIGDMPIEETTSYKYLGDILTNDGKNEKNLESRKKNAIATTTSINCFAANEILKRIETDVLLKLHEKVTVSGLLTNAESWTLNRGEKAELEKIEIQALKHLFDLPAHTPTPAIVFTLGTLFTDHRVEIKRLNYLHRILVREDDHWTKKAFNTLDSLNIGWSKSIKVTLTEYQLPTDYETIKSMTQRQWGNLVKEKVEATNRRRLYDDCHKTVDGIRVVKTKTSSIPNNLLPHNYTRKPCDEILQCTKQETKTIIIARFGMLDCGRNFKGSNNEICIECSEVDDEEHRLNHCIKYRSLNYYDHEQKVPFKNIFSTDVDVLREIISRIQRVWDTNCAHGTMKKEES